MSATAQTLERQRHEKYRKSDALAEMAEVCLADGVPKGATGDRYQVMDHVSAETFRLWDVSAET